MPQTMNAAEQAKWERDTADLQRRIATRTREQQRQQAEANRPKTLAEHIYGRTPQDGRAQREASINAGKVRRR